MARMIDRMPLAASGVVVLAALLAGASEAAQPGADAAAAKSRPQDASIAAASSADYEQGYRDGYGKQTLRDKNRSNKAYAEGFAAGRTDRERGVTTPRRPLAAGVPGASSRARSLVGRNGDNLESDMQALGYSWRAGTMKGRESHTTWRGASDSQCVRAVVRQGKVASITDVEASMCR